MRRAALLPVFALCATFAAAQDPDPAKVEMKVEKVAGTVYMLAGAGGNIGLSVGEDGVLVVDDEFASLVPKIQAAIKGITDQPVRFVLNTHWHGDHTGGNAAFSKVATVIAQDNVRRRLAEGNRQPDRPQHPARAQGGAAGDHVRQQPHRAPERRGHPRAALRAAATPTATASSSSRKSNVVHMGDDFVTYGLPFVDVASGGSVTGMIENVEKALAAVPDDVKVIPGHGALSTKADALKFAAMLRDAVGLVQAAMKQGKTLEQMKTENVLARYDALGQGFVKTPAFIELIYNELKGRPADTKQPDKRHH